MGTWQKLMEVNCGNLDVVLALCPGITESGQPITSTEAKSSLMFGPYSTLAMRLHKALNYIPEKGSLEDNSLRKQ